ncbi:hypothetical protein QCA50_005088 [Cerrena zonata]|uniref:4-coumarate--CoA ligase n=1 Tax=Cerrena zonata TaxID=2478898 RepID=A0AAW0GDU2_9APHY
MPDMKVYNSPYPPVEVAKESVFTFLFQSEFSSHPRDRKAFVDGLTGLSITRQQLKELCLSFAHGVRNHFPQLGGLPLKRGDAVLIYSPNSLSWPIMLFGSIAAGLLPTLANSMYTARELAFQWNDSGASIMLVHPLILTVALDALKTLGFSDAESRRRIVIADYGYVKRDGPLGKFIHLDDLLNSGSWHEEEKFAGDLSYQTALLCYSSGTTGKPKGVETMHNNITGMMKMLEPFLPKSEADDSCLAVLLFFHVYGAVNILMNQFYQGVPVVIMLKFDPIEFLQAIEKYKITTVLAVPPMQLVFARHPAVAKYDLKSLKWMTCSAAPLPPSLIHEVRKSLAAVGSTPYLTQGFGCTEASPAVSLTHYDDCFRKAGSVGRLLPNLEGRVVLENGEDAPQGQPGELWVRGPSIMKGYWNNPESTKNSITSDGWYKMGDIVIMDEEGFIYVVDRLKELIKYKGFQVPPAELEDVLIQHPEIADAGVVGIYSEQEVTEVPRAYIVRKPTSKSDPAQVAKEIQSWMESRVAKHKYLRGGVVVIDAIPRSAAGKMLRRELREMAKTEMQKTKAKL